MSSTSASTSSASLSLRSASLSSAGSGAAARSSPHASLRTTRTASRGSDDVRDVDPTPFTVGKEVDTNRRDADVPPRFYVNVSHYTPAARYKALELHLETDFERALAAGLLPFTVAAETAEDSLEWRVAAADVDVGEELPRLLRGVRAAARPAAFAAFAGALAVLEACRREPRRRRVAAMLAAGHAAGKAAPFVSAVRAALASPSRKANADMMVLLRALATCEPAVAAPLAPLLKRLLPSLLRLADDQNTVEAGYAGLKGAGRRRVVPMSTLVEELLAALQESVGWPAYRAIRSFWPLYVDLDFEARMRGRT